MTTITEPTHTIRLYLSGPVDVARQVIREHVLAHPLCVTIDPTEFIYTGGAEAGYAVGLLNYPRFSASREDLRERARTLCLLLLARTFQHSALMVDDGETTWFSIREQSTTPHNPLTPNAPYTLCPTL